MGRLEEIRGVGPATAEKLRAKGITSVEQICTMKPEELSEILGTSLAKAKDMINSAKEIALTEVVEVWTGKKMSEYRQEVVQYIPTGIGELDKLLGGGIPTDAITNVSGEFGAGKSQFCMTVAANCLAVLKRPVVFIETEPGTFSMARFIEIAEARGVENAEDNVLVIPAKFVTSPHTQLLAYEAAERKADEAGIKPGLMVVDSFSAKIRQFYGGREMLSARSQEIARHFGKLQELASKYNMAVLLTTQVYGVPDFGGQVETSMKFGETKRPYGGEFFLHSASINLMLTQVKANEWEIITYDVPYAPRVRIPFRIAKEGVVGLR